MNVRIQPTKLGVVVMKNDRDMEPIATDRIRKNREVELALVRGAHTFRPIFQANLFLDRGNPADLISVVRFTYRKDSAWIWAWPQPQVFERQTIFYPDVVLNLAPYRQGRSMLGIWEIEAEYTVLHKRQLEVVPQGRRVNFLLGLPFQSLATFQWEVVMARETTALLPTGERVRPSGETIRQQQASINMEDI